MAGDK